jgi:hypothetical protein
MSLRKPPRRRRFVLWFLLGLLATFIAGLALASHLAKAEVASKLEALTARFGLTVAVDRVDVPLLGGIALNGLKLTRRSDDRPVAYIARVDTDLSLIGALLGRRRPSGVDVAGLKLLVRWDDGLADLTRGQETLPLPESGPAAPIEVTIHDAEIGLEVAQTTPWGRISSDAISVRLAKATLQRDADRRLTLSGEGEYESSGHRSAISASVGPEGDIELTFARGAQLGLDTPAGPVWLAANGLSLGDSFVARGLGVRSGDRHLAVGRLALALGARGTALAERLLGSSAVDLSEVVLTRGTERFSVGRAELELTPGLGPSKVRLSQLGGTLSAPEKGVGLEGQIGLLELGLAPLGALRQALGDGEPLDAITTLRVSEPALTLLLPARPLGLPEPAKVESDDPAPFIGNDDELPPATPLPIAGNDDLLGLLLGSGDRASRDTTLLDLVPTSLRERLPGLLARITTLGPEIDRASLTVKETAGPVMLALEDASFSARASEGRALLGVKASVMRNGAEAAHIDLALELTPDLTLESVSGTASGRSIAHQLARFVPRLSVQEDADIDLSITYRRPHLDNAPHHVEGRVALRNFSFEYWRIADREIRDLEATIAFDASIDRARHRLVLSLPKIQVGAAHLVGSLDLTRKKGMPPSFLARLEMPRQDCGAAARSIPKGLIPNLSTLTLEGELAFKASLDLDLANPAALELSVESQGDDCRILSLGPGIDPAALRGAYIHHPREPRGVLAHIAVGPGTDQWVPAEKLPELVTTAAWVTEDRRWTEHKGVRWDLVERALKMDLEHGRFVYGGSTITQQLVKNLYLTRTKNLARKLEEAIIAWQMERVLTKEEILTLYVNCIEYGPEIYGIKQAARIYFDKKVKDLDALEAAFIMGLKPYPRAGYAQFRTGQLNEWWVKRVSHVLDFMAKFGPHLLTPEDVATFAPFQPKFATPSYLREDP